MGNNLKKKIRLLSQHSRLFSELYHKASGIKTRYYAGLPDEEYLKRKFKKRTGRKLNLGNPETFCEKIQWLKLNDHRPEYTIMVDKVLAKDYVAKKIGKEYIIPTLGVWDDPDAIDFDKLPNQFVLKCNHNSGGGMCICKDKAGLNKERTIRQLRKGLKSNSFLPSREWPYKNVPRKILAEQYMEDRITGTLVDYKFYCFNGEPKFLYVSLSNYHDGIKNDVLSYYDLNWNPAPFYRTDHSPFPYNLSKPEKFDEMLQIAGALSGGIPFVRVDLYYINGNVYFSEFTFSPGGGMNQFMPPEWERKMGSWIDLSLVKAE